MAKSKEPISEEKLFYLRRERLNSGGYTSGGTYFGAGQPLYYYENEAVSEYDYMRADCREDAKEQLRAKFGQEIKFAR